MLGYYSIPDRGKIRLTEKAWWRNLHVSPSTAELLRYSKRSWVHVRMDHVQCFQCKGKCGILLKSNAKLTGGLLGQLQNPPVGPSEVKEDSSFWGGLSAGIKEVQTPPEGDALLCYLKPGGTSR